MNHRNNDTKHFEIRFDDGEVVHEKCRDSIGGFQNMINRLRAHTGADNWGPNAVKVVGQRGSANGRPFTIVEVVKV